MTDQKATVILVYGYRGRVWTQDFEQIKGARFAVEMLRKLEAIDWARIIDGADGSLITEEG